MLQNKPSSEDRAAWREELYIIIFEADTFWGKFFDVGLLIAIILSIVAVMLESVEPVANRHGAALQITEWIFTGLFTIEYLARLVADPNPRKYALSFFGIVDIVSIIPAFLSLFITGAHALLVIRSIRLLRVFRIFKLVRFLGEANQLSNALKASRAKITVFIVSVLILVVIMGSLMYLVEGRENGFTSIPRSIYWAIVTLTTVGYGDIAPATVVGQSIASFVMILGYGIIAVPTGIVTAEMTSQKNKSLICNRCGYRGHDKDANYCKICGNKFSEEQQEV